MGAGIGGVIVVCALVAVGALGGGNAMNDAVMTLESVRVKRGNRVVLSDVDGHLPRGSMTAVLGPNGAGKSTLLKAMVGLLPLASGSIRRNPRSLDVAYLPQKAAMDQSFPLTVGEVVAMGAWKRTRAFKALPQRQWRREIAQALEQVGLEDISRRSIGALSTGQFQRVLFARLMLQDAAVVLLDEPFAGVDAATTQELLGLVEHWHGQGKTIVAVLHDIEQVRRCFPSSLLLAGRMVAWGPSDEVLSAHHMAQALELSGGLTDRAMGASDD